MKKAKRIIALLLALILAVSLCACGDKPANTGNETPGNTNNAAPAPSGPKYGGVFHYFRNGAPQSLFTILKTQKGGYSSFAVEQLGRTDQATMITTPFLAESFTEDKTNNTLTVKLRKGIKFHDGSDLTAEVVKWNLQFMMDNGNGSMLHNPLKIETPDDYTVVVYFDQYYLDMTRSIAQVQIYSKKSYDEKGLDWCKNNPVGTGPFVFKEYILDRQLTFTRNDNYWMKDENGNQLPYLDGVVVDIITETSASMTAFLNKEIDYISSNNIPVNDQIEAAGYKNVCIPTFGTYSTTGFSVNNNPAIPDNPWAKLEVRKAVMLYGLNAEELTLLGGGKYAEPSAQYFCLKGGLIYNEDIEKAMTYDVEKAKKMLADAGYPNGFSTDIYAVASRKDFAVALQAAFKKLGIEATVTEVTNADERRADPMCPGVHVSGSAEAYDPVARPITTMFSRGSTAIGKTVVFTDEYQNLLDQTAKAKSWEEKAELGKKMAYQATVVDCFYRNIYNSGSNVYMQDYLKGSGVENSTLTPEITWLDK